MKINLFLILTIFGLSGIAQVLTPPTSNLEAGVYTSAMSLEISHEEPGVTIFYTINGDDPNVSDLLYSGPITLDNRSGDPDVVSLIPTNPSLTYPFGTYSVGRATTRGWVPPYSSGYKINVIRYKAFKPGFAPSKTVTQTFIIDPSGADVYTSPIVSIAVDYSDFSQTIEEFMSMEIIPMEIMSKKGADWERILSLEYFERNGELAFAQNVRTRIHGGGSRHAPKKIYGYMEKLKKMRILNIIFFEDTELAKFKRILLKAGGHRPDCFPRDDLANMITKGINVEQQHFRHVIVFVNGEYWGIHSLKERLDNYMLQNLYGIDDNEITLLDQEYDIQGSGFSEDSAKLKNLEFFVDVNDMNDPANYKYVTDRIDVDNYIDYMCAEIYISNEDWVYSNVNIWRKTGDYDLTKGPGRDGRFRWALYDLDGAFGGDCSNAYHTVNTLAAATIIDGPFSSYSRFFRGMLGSDEFRFKFINRMNDLTNSWFKSSVVTQRIDSMYTMITPEVFENAVRWRYPSFADNLEDRYVEAPGIDRWNELFTNLKQFASRRPRFVRRHMMEKWGYSDSCMVTINVNDVTMGRVKVNSILINEALPGVAPSLYPWTGRYIQTIPLPLIAVPLPGYRFIEWLETGETNDTISWNPAGDETYTAVFEEDDSYQSIRINEVMLSNTAYKADEFDQFDDWLELYNPNSYPVNLSGCKLVRDGQEWVIPNDMIIAANGYKLFWHDSETYQGNHHVNFKLTNAIDTVFLYSPQDVELDYLRYPVTPTDNSYGRFPNGSETFANFTYPTALQSNDIASLNENVKILTPLSAYPNPSSDLVYLNKNVDFELYTINGALVLRQKNVKQFSVSDLKKGVYILRTSELETIKIIVN